MDGTRSNRRACAISSTTHSPSVFVRRYERAYRNGSPQRLRHVAAWPAVHAAARLAEGVEAEHARLVGVVDRARHRAGR